MKNAAKAGQERVISPYISILILTLATFMEVLDTTIANVALPRIRDFRGINPKSFFVPNRSPCLLGSKSSTVLRKSNSDLETGELPSCIRNFVKHCLR